MHCALGSGTSQIVTIIHKPQFFLVYIQYCVYVCETAAASYYRKVCSGLVFICRAIEGLCGFKGLTLRRDELQTDCSSPYSITSGRPRLLIT